MSTTVGICTYLVSYLTIEVLLQNFIALAGSFVIICFYVHDHVCMYFRYGSKQN